MANNNSYGISTCYGQWQIDHGEPELYCSYDATFTEGTVDTANNRSYVNFSASAYYDEDSALFYGTTRSNVGTLRVYINGNVVASKAVPMEYNLDDHHTTLVSTFTGGCWVNHNVDGTKSVTCQIKLHEGSDPRGAGFYWRDSYGNKVTLTLTNISRSSGLTISPQTFVATGESSLTCTITGTNGSSMPAAHDLIIRVGDYTTSTHYDSNYSFPITYTWTPSKDIIRQIGNSSKNNVAQVELRTWWSPSNYLTTKKSFIFVTSESASASIIKNGSKMTFSFNGQFFVYDGLFGSRTPLVSKIAVGMFQDKDVPLLPFVEIDRVVFTSETWNQLVENDNITIETEEAIIRKNNALNHRLGALGNDYDTFTLKPGMNYIKCLNSDWVDIAPDFKLKYREVYL